MLVLLCPRSEGLMLFIHSFIYPCARGQGALHGQVVSAPLKATQCRHSPSALRRLQPAACWQQWKRTHQML